LVLPAVNETLASDAANSRSLHDFHDDEGLGILNVHTELLDKVGTGGVDSEGINRIDIA
jgi:hypothetical protein